MIEKAASPVRWWPENGPNFRLDFGRSADEKTTIEYGFDHDVVAIGDFRAGVGISTQQNLVDLEDMMRLHGSVNAGLHKPFNDIIAADVRVKFGLNPFNLKQNYLAGQFALVPTHPTAGNTPDGPPPPLVPHLEVRRYLGTEVNEARLGLTIIFANHQKK